MKILFDFVSLQDNFINGGMLYVEKVLNDLLERNVEIFGLYDSKIPKGKTVEALIDKHSIELVDLNGGFVDFVEEKKIDCCFIGIMQRYHSFDLLKLKCRVYIVCHDLTSESLAYFDIINSKSLIKTTVTAKKLTVKKLAKGIIKFLLYPLVLIRRSMLSKKYADLKRRNALARQELIGRENIFVITVSEYSKSAFQYFYGFPKNEITVLYPPLANICESCTDSEILKDKKYFLLVSADREMKNASLLLEIWNKFLERTSGEYYAVFVGRVDVKLKNTIVFEAPNKSELSGLYKNAFALIYPSFGEGFGSPPVEAMSFGTPIICSNVTAVPEICRDSAAFFSPFYPEDLFKAMLSVCNDREKYVLAAKKGFEAINRRQIDDYGKLIKMLTSNN